MAQGLVVGALSSTELYQASGNVAFGSGGTPFLHSSLGNSSMTHLKSIGALGQFHALEKEVRETFSYTHLTELYIPLLI